MRVLYLTEDFPPEGLAAGGLRVSLRKQAEALAEHCDVTVGVMRRVLPPMARYRSNRLLLDRRAELSRANADAATSPAVASTSRLRVREYRYLHVPFLHRFTEPLQILLLSLWLFMRHARDADVVHGHTAYLIGLPAVILGRLVRRPTIVSVYGLDVHGSAVGRTNVIRWLSRFALRTADRLIAVSRDLLRTVVELGVDEARCRYVPSGVDVERFAPPRDQTALRRQLEIPENAYVFVATSLFVPVKGHAILVDALARVCRERPHGYLVMTGDGVLRPQIEARVAELGLADRVRFTGFLGYEDIPGWVAAADVMVLPSLSEGMPLCILESFASGKPLIGSRVGGIPELVSDERFGLLVPPAEPEALAAAMIAAQDRTWDVDVLRARATEYAWAHVAREVLRVYEELA